MRSLLLSAALAPAAVLAALNATETSSELIIANSRLYASVNKSTGSVETLTLDGQNLLGTKSGSTGVGPYLDCYCIPSGFWTPGSASPIYELYNGTDSTGTQYGGIKMSDTYPGTGQVLETYWFLRDGETGLHMFERLAYYNETTPFLRNLQEFRTLFRPNSAIWTHLLTNEEQWAPLPSKEAIANEVVVQDATWYLGNTPNDAYVQQEADYFTKYTFSDTWRNNDVHGQFADGTQTSDNSTYGSWLVMNTKDTYFGGPLHSDLMVDGIVYNYIVSNHHGDQTHYYYFNHLPAGTTILESHADALQYANASWNAEFYDSIAQYVPNYVPSSERGSFKVEVSLPDNAANAIAVLAQNAIDFQDNVFDVDAYQYWAEIDAASGTATIPRVKAGTYRLTIYAEGVFGDFVQDDVVVTAGEEQSVSVAWTEDADGTEVFRIGTPDKSSGEYRHGYARDATHPRHPEEYRIYWPVYDFVDEFPEGVTYKVGEGNVSTDLNYVHWSVFGGYGNSIRTEPYAGDGNVNNWTIAFDFDQSQYPDATEGTFTVLLAGAKTAAGNTDVYNASEPHANLKYTVNVNGQDLEPWVIPYYQSSSCAVRSAVICYNVGHKFKFPSDLLVTGENTFILSLPYNATDYESAVLTTTVYVQYDALRLELS
ncbi:Rhamnogalacturonate lyase B [Pestalotiopsis fici W106-1]|uniref:rhamnogalacturonan endolyase n=1 Tax=Pestalotiopsis fici (strain W106-1 / CGMCC3.15140) TaxID=1229662 RepID=W3XBL9_PESFW|nr:Rhamnogalacturonate lyase B [Pestalotiopsis fici W106-1]ETS82581.1 Rhamnogalacturonate lyase B [Pestalotiopsis fici W106-1]